MKIFKRIVALALIAATLVVVTGCTKATKTIMEYEGVKLSSGMFSYGLSMNKTQVLYQFTYSTTDNAALWAYDAGNGKTIGATVFDNYIENNKLNLIADAELKALGVKESDENVSYINTVYDANVSAQGNEAKLDVYLADFGLNSGELKEYYRLSSKFYELIDYYYGESGVEKLSEQQYLDNLKSEYVLVQHILYKTSKSVLDESANTSTEVSMSEEEAGVLKAEIEAKLKQITDGEKTYEDFVKENQDSNLEYLVSDSTNFVESFKTAAKEMAIGEIRNVQSEYGFHVMRKVEITAEKYAEMMKEDNANYSTVSSERSYLQQDMTYKKLEDKLTKVTFDEAEIAKYDITTAPVIQY